MGLVCIHSACLFLLVGAFNPFTFKVIIDIKHLPAMQETWVQSLGEEKPLEKGNGYLLQCSCLENPMDRGAWWATVHGVAKSQPQLSD